MGLQLEQFPPHNVSFKSSTTSSQLFLQLSGLRLRADQQSHHPQQGGPESYLLNNTATIRLIAGQAQLQLTAIDTTRWNCRYDSTGGSSQCDVVAIVSRSDALSLFNAAAESNGQGLTVSVTVNGTMCSIPSQREQMNRASARQRGDFSGEVTPMSNPHSVYAHQSLVLTPEQYNKLFQQAGLGKLMLV